MVRRLVIVAIVGLVVAAVAAAVLVVRPDLADARDRVDMAWVPLRGPLEARYEHLDSAVEALRTGGDGQRAITGDLATGLERWDELIGRRARDAGAEASAANALEALALRLDANVAASARLGANEGLGAALEAFDLAVVSPPDLTAYNRAARRYAQERDGVPNRLVAALLGFSARPALELGR